ncbi:hypothetical protein PIB30_054695 [Stylosanthes scabra]|uniref:Putative plant transposon protein domain-containing protein n=1 Tax=Stylosanthes scabra TaxID=79078 RepID=A0ABU6VHB7_9FABA|nr:hypothetical protein [Stylosanthes scabra]
MARIKTIARRPSHEYIPRSSSFRGKRPMTEEEEEDVPPPPPSCASPSRPRQGNSYRHLFHPVRETYDPNPCSYKEVFAYFPPEEFDERRFPSFQDHIFYKMIVVNCPLCSSFLVDLDTLSHKGLDFIHLFAFQGWLPLFYIKTHVYPDLVCEIYANMMYHKGTIMSYVKGIAIMLDKSRLSESLGYIETGICVFTSGNLESSLNITYQEALAYIYENPSVLDDVIPTHKSLSPVRAQLHRIVNNILMPQSGSYKRVSFCDTLMLFALIMKVPISFGYLMMKELLHFRRWCSEEASKEVCCAERRAVEEEDVSDHGSEPSTSTNSKVEQLLHVVEELMAKVAFLVTQMHDLSKGFKSTTHKSASTFEKAAERVLVQKRYVDKLKADHMFSDIEEEEEGDVEDDLESSDT